MSAQRSSRRRPRRRWPRRLARVAIATAVVGVVAFATRALWVPPVLLGLTPLLESRLGADLTVARVRGDGTGVLELEGVVVRPRGTGVRGEPRRLGPLAHLEADRLRVQLSLLGLLSGDPDWLRWVEAEGLDLDLDFSRPRPAGSRSRGGERGDLHLPGLLAERSRVSIALPGGNRLEAEDVALGAPAPPDRRGRAWAGLTAGRFAWTSPGRDPVEGPLAARLALDARGIDVAELSLEDVLRLTDARFAWADEPGLAWSGDLEVFGGELAVEGGTHAGALTLDFEIEGADVAAAREGIWPGLQLALAGTLERAKGELRLPYASPLALEGELALDVAGLVVGAGPALDVDGRLTAGDGELRSARLALSQPENTVVLEELVLPLGLASLGELLRGGRARVSVDARDVPALLAAEEAERVPEHRLELWAALSEGEAAIERGRLETPGGAVAVRGGTVTARPSGGPKVDLDLAADFTDLAPLGPILDTRPWAGSLAGSVRVSGDWPELSGSAELEGAGVTLAGVELGAVEAELAGDSKHVRVTRLLARGRRSELLVAGEVDLERKALDGVEFRLRVEDLAELVPWTETRGSLRLEGKAQGTRGALAGEWSLVASDAHAAGHTIDALTAKGVLDGDRARVEELDLETEGVRLALTGDLVLDAALEPVRLELATLAVAREGADLALVEPTSVALGLPRAGVERLVLRGSAGALTVGFTTDGGTRRFHLRAGALDPMPILAPFLPEGIEVAGLNGALEGELGASGLAFETSGRVGRLAFALDDLVGSPVEHVWEGEWEATYEERLLRLVKLEATGEDASQVKARGWLPLDLTGERLLREGDVVLWALLELPDVGELRRFVPPERPWPQGRARADLDLSGTWKALEGTIDVEATELDLDADGDGLFRNASLKGLVSLGERVTLKDVSVEVPGGLTLHADGWLGHPLDVTRLFAGERFMPGDTELSFEGGLIVEQSEWLDRLNRALRSGVLRRFGGRMAATLALDGTLDRIRPRGQLELDGGEVKFSTDLPALEGIAAYIRVDGGHYEIAAMQGEIGGSPFTVGGTVDLDAEPPTIDVSLEGENLLLYRAQGVKVRADTSLRVTGSPDEPRISGAVRLQDSRFVKRFDFFSPGRRVAPRPTGRALELFSFREAPLSDAVFDVKVTSERPFRIENNVVDARVRPDLSLVGTGETPEVTGTVYVDEGKVKLPSYDLYLRPGTITFSRDAPMVPRLELVLGNRIRGYEVTVNVGGPYDDPEILMSSSPPLGEEDLFALVWTGLDPGEGLSSRAGVRGAQAVGFYLAKDLLTRFLSDESTESQESFLDRFELYLGRDTTQDGDETIEVTYRMTQGVFSGRDTLYLATEQDEYAHINFGLRFVFRFQ